MADRLPPFWRTEDFGPIFDAWEQRENPSEHCRSAVLNWLLECPDDPYTGMRRSEEVPYLWWAPIPETEAPDGTYVLCSYFIYDDRRVVRCVKIASSEPPFDQEPA